MERKQGGGARREELQRAREEDRIRKERLFSSPCGVKGEEAGVRSPKLQTAARTN